MKHLLAIIIFAIVDGLDIGALTELREYWSVGGLRTLSEEAYLTSVSFPHLVYGGDETTATIMTGQTPFYHGYAEDTYFLRRDRHIHLLMEDPSVSGINTPHQLSPAQVTVPTLADKYRLRYGDNTRIYAVGIHPTTAILLAGHAANACCWIESANAGWATTSFYSNGLPSAADRMNTNGRFQELSHRTWTNRMDINTYLHPTTSEKKHNGFSFTVNNCLTHSPAANTLVTELALELQQEQQLGKRQTPDMLLLQYTVVSPNAASPTLRSAEQEDMYMGLNQDLGYLIEQLSRRIGKENIELVLVGRPVSGTPSQDYTAIGLPVGSFNIDRAAALAGTYLMALYGHERWIDGGYGNSIYLNHNLIEQKKMSLPLLKQQVADFLSQMAGVHMAYPVDHLRQIPGDEQIQAVQNSLTTRSGDVILTLQYGWTLMHNETTVADYVLDVNPMTPLYLWYGAYHTFPSLPNPLPATQILQLLP